MHIVDSASIRGRRMTQQLRRFKSIGLVARILARSREVSNDMVRISFDRSPWHAEKVGEMLEISTSTAIRLSSFFEIPWSVRPDCLVTDEDSAMEIQGTTGAAYQDTVLIG